MQYPTKTVKYITEYFSQVIEKGKYLFNVFLEWQLFCLTAVGFSRLWLILLTFQVIYGRQETSENIQLHLIHPDSIEQSTQPCQQLPRVLGVMETDLNQGFL